MKCLVAQMDFQSRAHVCALIILLFPLVLSARVPQKSDYISFGMNAGYSALVGQYTDMKVFGGFSGGLHLGYEYREGNFWLDAAGELQYLSSICQSDITVGSVYFQDTRQKTGLMSYEMTSKLREMQNFGLGNLVIMAGYCSGTHVKSGIYVGAGVKVGCKFDITNTVKQSYTTSATYEDYIDPYHDMPDHYYNNYTVNDTVAFGSRLNVSLIGEFGWDLRLTRCDKVKVGFFVEAGLTNIMRDLPTRQPRVNPDNVSQIIPYSAYNRADMQNTYIVPVVAGLKVSLLFNVSRIHDKCRTCPCYRKR